MLGLKWGLDAYEHPGNTEAVEKGSKMENATVHPLTPSATNHIKVGFSSYEEGTAGKTRVSVNRTPPCLTDKPPTVYLQNTVTPSHFCVDH